MKEGPNTRAVRRSVSVQPMGTASGAPLFPSLALGLAQPAAGWRGGGRSGGVAEWRSGGAAAAAGAMGKEERERPSRGEENEAKREIGNARERGVAGLRAHGGGGSRSRGEKGVEENVGVCTRQNAQGMVAKAEERTEEKGREKERKRERERAGFVAKRKRGRRECAQGRVGRRTGAAVQRRREKGEGRKGESRGRAKERKGN